jgi:GAF domain-containing protein
VADDDRWPRFGPACAHRTGVHSILSIRLSVAGEDHAALNFYGRQPHIFDDHDLAVAAIIAPFAALAVEHRLRLHDTHHLQEALASSRQIGTAVGIIMARHLVSSSEALARLKRASQDLNRKLRDIAAEVERTGELPHR